MTGFKTFICSCVYFHFHTDDGLSKNRNVCTYCYAHKIMKFITFALVFSFILCCWPKTNIINRNSDKVLEAPAVVSGIDLYGLRVKGP